MNTSTKRAPKTITLHEVAERLNNSRVSAVVAGYSEYQVSVKRTIALAVIIAWALFWSRGALTEPPQGWQHLPLDQVLPIEAVQVLPWLLAFFGLSVVWTFLLRTNRLPQAEWVDMVGSIANLIGIGVMLVEAWNLTLATITLLPLASIIIGARFGRRAFYLSMAFAVVVVGISAPENYWIKRPAFGVFALVLLVGLPLTVNRLLSALWTVSEQAVLARDSQNRFIATMSHELRTPLNTVIVASGLIDTKTLAGDQRRLLLDVTTNAQALLTRVNDVLDVASINRGSLSINERPFRLQAVVDTVRSVSASQAASKSIVLDVETAAGVPDGLVGDPGRIEQALTNLVTNAVKFTPENGRVKLSVRAERVTATHATLNLSVADTGIGIPEADKARIFDAFYQVSAGSTRRHGGVGLGLYIVHSVIEQMGGVLEVADNPGGGTIFNVQVTLPLAKAIELEAGTQMSALDAIEHHRGRVKPLRCLVIEDNASNTAMIARILQACGHTMRAAADGASGLAIAAEEQFDVILLDLHMPGLSGFQVLDSLAGRKSVPPVIVLSADSEPGTLAAVREKGAMAYVSKPISTALLLGAIEAAASKTAPSLPPAGVADGGSTPLQEIREFGDASEVQAYLAHVRGGLIKSQAALEAALSAGHLELARNHAHAIKNELAGIGRKDGVVASATLEQLLQSADDTQGTAAVVRQHVQAAMAWIEGQPEMEAA